VQGIQNKYLFGGRLGDYKYYDIDDTIKVALELADQWIESKKE
jgi:UDP-galactopyranose mutase